MTAAVWVLLLAGTLPRGGPPGDPCRLLSRQEVAEVAGARIDEAKATSRNAGELRISDCFYRAQEFQDSVSLEVTRASEPRADSAREHWDAVFHPASEPEREEAASGKETERESGSPPRSVPGIGDEAFWVANRASGALYVRKDGAYIRISVGGAAEEASKLQRATDLARKALGRL